MEAVTWLIGNRGRYELILAGANVKVGVSVSHLAKVESADREPWLRGTKLSLWWEPVEYVSSEEMALGFEVDMEWYGQEKKLWVNIVVCLCLPPPVCLSHTTEASNPFENKVLGSYFYEDILRFFPHHG